MQFLYNLFISTAAKILPLVGFFNPKMKLFIDGRKNTFLHLKKNISSEDKIFWFHAASLGEYEQGVPVIKELKTKFPEHKILLTFFSPSGYEVKKSNSLADIVVYLPLDTKSNVRRFLDLVNPEWTVFIKYEFWPNYLNELRKRQLKTILISGRFRKDQAFFKFYGSWFRKNLEAFAHLFVQDEKSKKLLSGIGISNVTVNGDTRFDRVLGQLEQDNTVPGISEFKDKRLCLVAGSTWPEDEEILKLGVEEFREVKFIIAPHSFDKERIGNLKKNFGSSTVLYSEKGEKELKDFDVLIIDNIGMLGRIYTYADMAFVGGAVGKTGLHNILEPAAFGIPIVTGTHLEKFPEAVALQKQKGLITVSSKSEFSEIFFKLIKESDFRARTGKNSRYFIERNAGATEEIIFYFLKNY